jgi:23S rRNA (cytosine1962-C5)-methyltransferase
VASIKLKKGRSKSFLRKHPWIFSGAIDSVNNIEHNGETVEIFSSDGKLLGYGSYSFHSQISIRVLSFYPSEKIDTDLFRQRIESSIRLRNDIINKKTTNTYRLINGEGDFLPGLIVDIYNKYLICQFLSAGAEFWKKEIIDILSTSLDLEGIFERSDLDIRKKEGLNPIKGIIWGKEPPDLIEVIENGNKFLVDVKTGHKTGFYLDQRDNRNLLLQFSAGVEVLNCFSYTGGFSVYSLKGGANKVTNVDSSSEALNLAGKNISINGFDSSK